MIGSVSIFRQISQAIFLFEKAFSRRTIYETKN
jgi:hypothetical protein